MRQLLTIALLIPLFGISLGASELDEETLAYMPANRLIPLFEQGTVTPLQVLEAQIARIENSNEQVNCITYTHFDAAREAARESGLRYAQGRARPLEGITVAIKDEHYDVGWRVTQGSLVHKEDPPKDHADPIVSKLKQAGAILHIQTTVPELYLHYCTSTRAWGTSRNPWNLKYSVGGSSGGSGAALAAGYATLATGSDMGGSIRIPAAFNGLYGYKPAFGQYHTDLPMCHFSGSGPMSRTPADLALMHNVISGPAPHSINVHYNETLPDSFAGLTGLRIAYVGGMGILEPSAGTTAAIEQAIATLRAGGATVDVVQLDLGKTPDDMVHGFSNMALAGPMGGLFAAYAEHADQLTPYGRYFVEKSAKGGYGNDELYAAENLAKELYAKIVDTVFAQGYDAMILPTLPTSHILADHDFTTDKTVDEGRTYPKLEGGLYTVPFNMLNWCPVISVPAGLTEQNMPVGMQIIGLPTDTETVFRIAAGYYLAAEPLFVPGVMPAFK